MAMYENIRKLFKRCNHNWVQLSVSVEHHYVFDPFDHRVVYPYSVAWEYETRSRINSYTIESWVNDMCENCGKTRVKRYFGDITANGKKQDSVKQTDKRVK